jgi:tetratricopeptide (TPR) repeat protein
LGETEKAIEYYEQALKIFQGLEDRQVERGFLGNMGLAYSGLGELRKAIDYYEQALKIAQEIGDRQVEGKLPWKFGDRV